MSIFRELTDQEHVRRSLILQSTTSSEAMRMLEPREVDLSVAIAKVAAVMVDAENPFPGEYELNVGDVLYPSGTVGKSVNEALGRAMLLQNEGYYETPEDITTGILSDVHSQAGAHTLLTGIADLDVAKTLSDVDQRIVSYALEDEDVKNDIVNQSNGKYHKLNEDFQSDLKSEMNGSNLPQSVKNAIDSFSGTEDYRYEHAGFTTDDVQRDSGNRQGRMDRVANLLMNDVSTGVPAADQAIKTVYANKHRDLAAADPEQESAQLQRILHAGGRLLEKHDRGTYVDPKAGAALMLNDMEIMRDAAFRLQNNRSILSSPEQTHDIASGTWHKLDDEHAAYVAKNMNELRYAPSFDVINAQSDIIKSDAAQNAQRQRNIKAAQMQQAQIGM